MANTVIELSTSRLTLRQWQDSDLQHFREINADPEVMRFYPKPLTALESDQMAEKIIQLIEQRGWGFWALELKSNQRFIGFTGLHIPEVNLSFCPCVEIGWRLSKAYWNRGYATEAASAVLKFGFHHLALEKIYSFASINNIRSRAVMERIGMENTHDNFEHPAIADGSHLKTHVLYQLKKSDWALQNHYDGLTAKQNCKER